jgi:ankyrin repeat protein
LIGGQVRNMAKQNKPKNRETLEEILARLSDRMFPAELGSAVVAIDSREADGDTPLHNLIYSDENYPIQTLLAAGANVNAVGNMGYTPLHVAAWRDNEEIILILLEAGADRTLRCNRGQTAAEIAATSGYDKIAKLLK